MTTFTVADLQVLVDTAVKAALSAKAESGRADKGHRLDERHFRRVDKYCGGPGWKEFAFQLRTSAGAASSRVREVMDEIVKA